MRARARYRVRGTPGPWLLAGVLAAVLATGCAGVNRLREAQEAFNQAAAAENALRLDHLEGHQTDDGTLVALAAAGTGYASALLSLERMDAGDVAQLKRDGLWGNALTLKALAEWRLGLYDKARATAAEALQTAGDQIQPRDRALLRALPGLIKNDEAYRKIYEGRPLKEVEDLLRESVADLKGARDSIEEAHPVQLYLIQAQLVTYRNLRTAYSRLDRRDSLPDGHPARAEAQRTFDDLSKVLKQLRPEARPQIIAYWARLCGDLRLPQ
jgi:hypothetical protein